MPINASPLGDFVPTTNVWDVDMIQEVEVNSPEFKELLVRLYQNVNAISTSLNARDSGYYPNNQIYINGQLFFPTQKMSPQTLSIHKYGGKYIE